MITVVFLCFSGITLAEQKNSFVALSVGSSFKLLDNYNYSGLNGAFTYGYRMNSHGFGVIGANLGDELEGGLLFGYEQNFINNKNFVPGVNISLLLGVANQSKSRAEPSPGSGKNNNSYDYSPTLGVGADLGFFLKLGPSVGKYQGVAQTGLKYYSAVSDVGESFKDKFVHYINVGIRINF